MKLQFLQQTAVPIFAYIIENVNRGFGTCVIFQQDGAPLHDTQHVQQYSDADFQLDG